MALTCTPKMQDVIDTFNEADNGYTVEIKPYVKSSGSAPTKVEYHYTDLEVDILDVIAVNKYILGASTLNESEAAAADVDADGKVTVEDALMILKYVIKLIDAFA